MHKPAVLAIVGPTGSGKTAAAIHLCKHLNAEIVSMDSMQIYRGMDIGTAKPTLCERQAAVHHMIDVVDPEEIFTVSAYKEMVMPILADIFSRGKVPILVGGTGLYLNAISYEMNMGENGASHPVRDALNRIAEGENGPQILHDKLSRVDPETAKRLHPNDVRRVVRALEVYETTGKPMSALGDEEKTEGPYHVMVYGLSYPRDVMYERINRRVDCMVQEGLVAEVQRLLEMGIEPRKEGGAMQAIGYKEIVSALRGEITMERAIDLIKQGSRRYAKRQWTWFRHDSRVKWFDFAEYDSANALYDRLLQCIGNDLKSWQGA
jgi:tRNA dimethylallyltransferase